MAKTKTKLSVLKETLLALDAAYGKGSVMSLGDTPLKIDVIPSGSIALDTALGIGGYPKGRIVEIFGPESSGKTTLTIHAIAECQKLGGKAIFIDAEHAFDPTYASNVGVNIEELYISQPDNGEQALDIAEKMIMSGAIDLVVIDSVAALTPKSEIEASMADSQMGLQARMMGKAMRKLAPAVSKNNCCVIFINQLRDKIGIVYGNPETTTGGNALKFYASVRLDIRRIGGGLKSGESEIYGNHVKVKVTKNKLAPPFKIAEFNIIFGTGIDTVGEVLDGAVEIGLIEKAGSWYKYDGNNIAQGAANACSFLKDNPELYEELKNKVTEWKRN